MPIRAPTPRVFARSGVAPALADTTRPEPREPKRNTPLRLAEDFRSPPRARAHPEGAHEEFPRRLAPACSLLSSRIAPRLRRLLRGGRSPNNRRLPIRKDARAHPYEPLILLRARLQPLSAFDSADPAFRRADAIVPSVISAWARSHAFCDSPCGRSLDRRSREVPLTIVGRRLRDRPGRERARGVSERAGY